MNPSERNAKRAEALLPVAQGLSNRAVGEQVGVSAATVGVWKRDLVFAEQVERVKEAVARRPVNADALLEVVRDARARLDPPAGSGGPVVVSIPAGASARRRRQLLARGVARALERGER